MINRLIVILFLFLLISCDAETKHVRASKLLFDSNNPKDQEKGFALLHLEYESGSAYSAGKIGWAYQKGLGVEPDLSKAVQLYTYAAEHGMTYWQYMLAHAYEMGYLGLERNLDRRDYWLKYKDRRQTGIYECWVSYYYSEGFYPTNAEVAARNEEICTSH